MSARHRINGTVDYTCENVGYVTNVSKGYVHGRGQARGSVFRQSLIRHGGYSLWLEHVTEKASGADTFWLMWYHGGIPTIPLSGVLDASDIQTMAGRLASFIQVP
jgi:hypothetical protein